MENRYENLQKLNDLFKKGVVNESEYIVEKEKILNSDNDTAVYTDNSKYNMWMHISQLSNMLIPGGGFIIPIVMWMSRNEDKTVDTNGKIVLNWNISVIIYIFILIITAIITGLILIPMTDKTQSPLPALSWIFGNLIIPFVFLGVLNLLFVIVGAVKASKGEIWNYPLSIRFFKTK